jgi:hypothetical protein
MKDGRLYMRQPSPDRRPAMAPAATAVTREPAEKKPSMFERLVHVRPPRSDAPPQTAPAPQPLPAVADAAPDKPTLADRMRSLKLPKWTAWGRSDSEARR